MTGAALRAERLSKNIPVTLDNTRVYDSSSYLTANPASLQNLAEKAEEASALVNGGKESREVLSNGEEECADFRSSSDQQEDVDGSSEVSDQEIEDEMDEEDQEASARRDITIQPPPRILITTSPSPCKQTYQFCDDLKNVFPGGEFFKRPKGKGFEIGRVSRWASKRGYGALIVVNEDHKIPSESTARALLLGSFSRRFRCRHLDKPAFRTHCILQAFQHNTFIQHLREFFCY